MTNDEIRALPGSDNPVLCADGAMGMLIIHPSQDGLCGVQVHGEPGIRWIPCADLSASPGGALRQAGGPALPVREAPEWPAQALLALAWAQRGGVGIPSVPAPRPDTSRFLRIEPTKDRPEPHPPTSGNWIRDADGGLTPADEETARTAGMLRG